MSDGLICCICPTLNRPELLGRAIRCFTEQSYQNRFLIIVCDGGQFENQRGDRWELISLPRRIMSLGEKNNVTASLAPRNVFAYHKWDDDDFYSPWALEAAADALETNSVVQPRRAMDFVDGRWVITETFNRKHPNHFAYHGGWSMRRSTFKEMRGYAAEYAGDDGELQKRLLVDCIKSGDISPKYQPYYWYNRGLAGRISERTIATKNPEQAYWDTPVGRYVGTVPKWKDDSDWLRPIPTETIARPW